MPYKKVEDRRKAYKRWAKKNRDKKRELVRIQKLAKYHNPVRKICCVKKCTDMGERHHFDYSKPKEIIWLCKKHHEMFHHKEERKCSVDSCNRKHLAKGMCHYHYYKK